MGFKINIFETCFCSQDCMVHILLDTSTGLQVRKRKTGASSARSRASSAKSLQFWPFEERASSKRDIYYWAIGLICGIVALFSWFVITSEWTASTTTYPELADVQND